MTQTIQQRKKMSRQQIVNNTQIFIWSSLVYADTRRAFNPFWCLSRFKIYLKYTLPSVLRQTAVNCKPLLICDALTSQTILNDKKAEAALNISGALISTSDKDLSAIFCAVPNTYSTITMMHIDSDDMYAPDAASTFNSILNVTDSVGFVRGNMWWTNTDQFGFFVHPCPPFYAQKYVRKENGDIYFNEHKRGTVCRRSSVLLSPGKFLVLRHGSNWSQNHYLRKFYLPFRKTDEQENVRKLYQLDENYWLDRQDEVAEFVDN